MSMTQQLQQLEVAFAAASAGETIIGRVERVSGVRVEVRFEFEPTQDDHGSFHLAVGTLLGIRSQTSIVVGVLAELEIDAALADTPANVARGTIDLVGEIFLHDGAPRFHRGVLNQPRLDAAVLDLSAQHLNMVFGDERPGRAHLGHLHQDGRLRFRPTSIRWCASILP